MSLGSFYLIICLFYSKKLSSVGSPLIIQW